MQSVNPHLDCWLMTADSELGMILADWTEAAAVDSEHDEDYVKLDQWLAEAAVAACAQLSKKVSTFYPSINHWLLQEAHAGVRAMAPRTPWGKLPLIGCIDEIVNVESLRKLQFPYYWIFGGLGSRGLIYHAWLGKKIAQAVVSRSEASLPKEFLSWKSDRKY